MKRKIITALLISCISVSIVSCGNSSVQSPKNDSHTEVNKSTDSSNLNKPAEENEKKEQEDSIKKDLPDGDYQEMGNGVMNISTAGGTSENGNKPIIFVNDEILLQIGLDTSEFNGSVLSYIYIDGMLTSKEQLSESQITLDLQGNSLSAGTHKVEVVQYDNNEETGNMITYKTASYEIKAK